MHRPDAGSTRTTPPPPDAHRVVYVVSFPKSGRTWVEMMLGVIVSELTGHDLAGVLRGEPCDDRWRALGRKPLRVVFGHGHDNGALCRDGRFCDWFYRGQRVALLVRDPRDVVVSHYHYERFHYRRFQGSLGAFLDYPYLDEDPATPACRYGLDPIINTMNGWLANRHIPAALEVWRYESLREHTHRELVRLCAFLGLDAPPDLLDQAIERSSIERMRRLEDERSIAWSGLRGSDDPRGRKVRAARVGGYRDELTEAQIAWMDERINDRLDPAYASYRR